MDEQTRLSNYKQSLRTAWGYNDYNDWPVKLNAVLYLFLKEFTAEFLEDLTEAAKNKSFMEDIADAFQDHHRGE